MNWSVVASLVLLLVLLRWKRVSLLTWVLTLWFASLLFLEYGFATPIPQSVISLYMGVITGVLLIYISSDRARLQEVQRPLTAFLTERKYAPALWLLVILIPGLVAANVYRQMTAPVTAPFFARTIHPATPDAITVNSKEYDMVTLENPFRPLEETNPQQFQTHLKNGKRIYYQNCFYCHGDNMTGNGLIAHGLNPIPTNFADSGTIAMLQESFLFWRISKGGPGLPEEGGPWESAMPAWEKFLTEEEIWEVILFLYDFTNQRPRARTEVAE